MLNIVLQLIGGGLFLISLIFLLFSIKKYKDFEKRDDVKFYKGTIESVEINGGLICNVRLDETNELIRIDNMDSIVVMEYVPEYGVTNNYNALIGKKIKFSKDANGKIEYDIAYKKKIRICLMYVVIGLLIFSVSFLFNSHIRHKIDNYEKEMKTIESSNDSNTSIIDKTYKLNVKLKKEVSSNEIQNMINDIKNIQSVKDAEQIKYNIYDGNNMIAISNIYVTFEDSTSMAEIEHVKNLIENNNKYKEIVDEISQESIY